MDEKRICPLCGKGFYPHHGNEKYCSGECARIANRKRSREYYRNNPEKFKEYRKRYSQEHRDKFNEYQRTYRETHKDEMRAYQRRYYHRNKKKILERRALRKAGKQ